MRKYKIVKTDVLVIGAGGAGLRAAIEAKNRGVNVFLVGKEVLGCAHTGMAMGGMNAAIVPPATPRFHFQITMDGGYNINNPKLVEAFTEEIPARIYDLEKYGVLFDRTKSGDFYVWAGPKQKYPLNVCVGDYTGREMMQGLVDEARKIGVQYLDEFFISKILVEKNRVVGAIGIHLKTGQGYVFQTKAIILATGGAGRMYEVTTNAASNTGDGYAMALNAGAELIDMEMTQFHPTGMAYPPSNRGVLITEKTRAHGGILENIKGERFMKKYHPKEMELAKRDEVSRAIYQEVAAGRGTKNGAVYLYVTHWTKEKILQIIPDVYEIHKNVGIDISQQPMEVYPSMHHMMGGIKIDEWGRTSVLGLFAAGEVAGGMHGANRLGGNSIAEGQVTGMRAATTAVNYASETKLIPYSKTKVKEEIQRVNRFKTNGDGISPTVIEEKLKKVMWEKVGIFRDGKNLELAKKEITKLIEDSKSMKVRVDTTEYSRDLQTCFEVENMLKTAEAVVEAAIIRCESRGAHSRTDYPKMDEGWKKNIAIFQNNGKLKSKILPVVTLNKIKVELYRGNPSTKSKPFYQTFFVPYKKGLTVLDILMHIYNHDDPSIAFRYECRQGVCGTCGLMYNGKAVLSCSTQVDIRAKKHIIAPLSRFPVKKDTVVDLEPFLKTYMSIKPFMMNYKNTKITKKKSEESKAFRKCIECGCCVAAQSSNGKLDPMSIVKIARYLTDPREEFDRKKIISGKAVNYSQQEAKKITSICPRGIPIDKAIKLLTHK